MTQRGQSDAGGPGPEQLAAYADGELDAEARAEVEAWLNTHPGDCAEVEALHRLGRLWEDAAPPEPGPDAWAGVLARIEAALPGARAGGTGGWRRLGWGLALLTGAAAALVVAATLSRGPAPEPAVEPLPVVSADEVEIISLDAEGARALVVGEPPVREQLALLAHGEVTLDDVKGPASGMSHYYPSDGSMPPMVFIVPSEEEP